MKHWIEIIGILIFLTLLPASCGRAPETRFGPVPGVSGDEILIGSSLALEGHAGYLGTQTLHGALAYINFINEQGGIHGRKIRVIAYDDGYDPPRCVANTQKLINEDRVFALFSYVGTPTSVKIIPIVKEGKIPLLGLFTGASVLREPFNRYIINVRASYYQETDAMVKHFVEDLDIRKIAVFYQYDDYGLDGLRGTEIGLKKYGLVPVATGSYVRGTMDVEDGLDRIMASGAEAVIMIGTYDPCAKFIKLARTKGFNPMFHNVSFVGSDELARKLGAEGEGVIITQVVPPPEAPEGRTLLWGIEEYSNLLKKYYPEDELNFVGFEGYINAKVLVEGLRRAGRDITRENFIDAIDSIRKYSLGIANTLTFGPDDHQGLERVYFTQIKDGKFALLADWEKIRRARAVPGVTDTEIVLGSSLALEGHAGYLGTQTLHGALAYINFINEQGGIHGRKIRVIAYDDGYDPPRCVANTRRLINEDRVFALFSYVGTPTSVKIIPIVEEEEIPLLGLFTGANALREPFKRYIINVRASYYQETDAVVQHFVEDLDIRKIAVFYQDDDYGFDGLRGAEISLAKYGLTPVATGSYVRGTMDVEEGLERIMASEAEAVVMIGTSDPCAKFISLARAKGFNPMFHNVSFVGSDELARKLGGEGEGVIITQVVPPPDETVLLPAAEDYALLLAQYYPQHTPTFVGFEGFINAKILVEGLRRTGKDLTREDFIDAIETLNTYFVGIGAKVSFGPDDHQGLSKVYFTRIEEGKAVMFTEWKALGR
ncbi:MAG: ABC transporter substrate-binding protein [Desulfobulbaceae bacterium]|nr:ABC transporter substrate-binding protein [Desulfobulbaceae bacterium]